MTKTDAILVPLAEGFEEIEAVTIIDVLRRAGLNVTVVGLEPGLVRGSHGLSLATDCTWEELDLDRVMALVLPGGMPGTTNLMGDARVLELVRKLHGQGQPVAAICAAPLVLAAAGVLGAGQVTAHPGVQERLARMLARGPSGDAPGPTQVVESPRVVRQGTLLTSQGVGTALEFSLALVADLVGPEMATRLARAMVVAAPD
ncbi:MAG: 4-methyl-5(b-hydroxyethyl)-thiazole monophosphate biosynthesis [Planctomycetota bacterium]|jgi:4-methyl-5(b-hydroxyethyl)-thiazole monophosphate biosynthesis